MRSEKARTSAAGASHRGRAPGRRRRRCARAAVGARSHATCSGRRPRSRTDRWPVAIRPGCPAPSPLGGRRPRRRIEGRAPTATPPPCSATTRPSGSGERSTAAGGAAVGNGVQVGNGIAVSDGTGAGVAGCRRSRSHGVARRRRPRRSCVVAGSAGAVPTGVRTTGRASAPRLPRGRSRPPTRPCARSRRAVARRRCGRRARRQHPRHELFPRLPGQVVPLGLVADAVSITRPIATPCPSGRTASLVRWMATWRSSVLYAPSLTNTGSTFGRAPKSSTLYRRPVTSVATPMPTSR